MKDFITADLHTLTEQELEKNIDTIRANKGYLDDVMVATAKALAEKRGVKLYQSTNTYENRYTEYFLGNPDTDGDPIAIAEVLEEFGDSVGEYNDVVFVATNNDPMLKNFMIDGKKMRILYSELSAGQEDNPDGLYLWDVRAVHENDDPIILHEWYPENEVE